YSCSDRYGASAGLGRSATKGRRRMTTITSADRRRRVTNAVMTSFTALCTLFAICILLIIFAYIAWQGIGSVNLRFLLDSPRPVGEGGGIGNAIVGSLVLLLLASAFGMPLGIAVGVLRSVFGIGKFATLVRFVVDT